MASHQAFLRQCFEFADPEHNGEQLKWMHDTKAIHEQY